VAGNLFPALSRSTLRPGYLLAGDELFFRDRFRRALIELLVPPDLRDFSIFDEDLATTGLGDILDRARNASLMAPTQLFFIRNVKELFGRGAAGAGASSAASGRGGRRKHGDFPANLDAYMSDPNLSSVLVFIADHVHIPVDRNRISLDDKSRLKRLQETIGRHCEMLLCARVAERQGMAVVQEIANARGTKIAPAAAQLLLELLGGDLGLVNSELDKLLTFAGPNGTVTRALVEQMVYSAQQRSAFDLARSLAARSRPLAFEALAALWAAEGDSVAIPLLFQLSRAFKMALVARERRARDRGMLYSVLPEGLKPPGFAADDVLELARRLPSDTLTRGIMLMQRADVWLRSNPPSARLVVEQVLLDLTAAEAERSAWNQQELPAPV
jgi:DNA polymerase-3 subunit delta